MRKNSNETKLDKGIKKAKLAYYIIAAIGTAISAVILLGLFYPRKSKKIESISDCPEELIPGQDDDEDEAEEL